MKPILKLLYLFLNNIDPETLFRAKMFIVCRIEALEVADPLGGPVDGVLGRALDVLAQRREQPLERGVAGLRELQQRAAAALHVHALARQLHHRTVQVDAGAAVAPQRQGARRQLQQVVRPTHLGQTVQRGALEELLRVLVVVGHKVWILLLQQIHLKVKKMTHYFFLLAPNIIWCLADSVLNLLKMKD